MKKSQYNFNLIEIVLTVAVISFGVTVILGMLPRGLQAVRNAGMESYSSEVIDQMASYLQQRGASSITVTKKASEEKDFLKDIDADIDEFIMKKYPLLVDQSDLGKIFDDNDIEDKEKKLNFKRTNATGIFSYTENDIDKSIYVVVMGDEVKVDDDVRRQIDFSGMIRIWKRPREFNTVRIKHIEKGVVTEKLPDDHDCIEKKCDENGFDKQKLDAIPGAVVCMELSYPLSLPYKERTKKYYVFEVDK